MRTTLAQLQQDVIWQARLFTNGDDLASSDLARAVSALDEYLDEHLDSRGAHNNQQTSIDAAMNPPMLGSVRRRIIDEIRACHTLGSFAVEEGLTDDQLERRLHRSHTTVSSARNWLVNAGWLTDSRFRRNTPTGREAIVWTLTSTAKQKIADPSWVERSKTTT